MHAFALPDEILKKVYRENALKLLTNKRAGPMDRWSAVIFRFLALHR
jgi:hypothetical protein